MTRPGVEVALRFDFRNPESAGTAMADRYAAALDMAAWAAEIAAGDLFRCVLELVGPRAEMGCLATALNGMLAQVETAFAARAESEARMTRFVADAGHELRTPLAGIKGLTDLRRMGAVSDREDIDTTMARIARESDRLARLVEDMLLPARFDELSLGTTGDSGPVLELAPTDLRTLAADALHDVRALDATRPVTLTGPHGTGAPASAPALADEARLRQVVTNLVGNAVAHTPPGTPIRIGVGTAGGDAVLEVADEGPGLRPPGPPTSSNASTAPTRPALAPPVAPAWVWPSSTPWSPRTRGELRSTRRPDGGRPSGSGSRFIPNCGHPPVCWDDARVPRAR